MTLAGPYRIPSLQLTIGMLLLFLSLQSGSSEAPETFAHALGRHGIALTSQALVDALSNPDKEVRGLAAAGLGELKATDSLPEILRAAEMEQDPLTRVNIADAATWLGSVAGLKMIKGMCVDSTLPPSVRETAARNVFGRGDHGCFRTVADMMLPSEDADTRIGAFELLSQLHDRTEEESGLVFQRLVAALTDPDLSVRMETCEGLRWLNNQETVPFLRNALANEREDLVRTRMQAALDSLAKPKS